MHHKKQFGLFSTFRYENCLDSSYFNFF